MNDKTQMANDILKKIDGLRIITEKIQVGNAKENISRYDYLVNSMIIMSEKLTCSVRRFGMFPQAKNHSEIMEKVSDILEISVGKNNGVVEICIPAFLPRKRYGKSKYITDPLKYKLNEAAKETDLRIENKAVVCFVYVYNEDMSSVRCYDYDNLETKNILDVISLYTLRDDGPEYINVYHKMQRGSKSQTMIYVIPEDRFFSRFGPR